MPALMEGRPSRAVKVHVVYQSRHRRFVARIVGTDGRKRQFRLVARDRTEAHREAREVLARECPRHATWSEFRRRYEAEHLTQLSRSSIAIWHTVCNSLEGFRVPEELADVTTSYLSEWSGSLLLEIAPTSVASYLRALRAALNWAAKIWPAFRPPAIIMPLGARQAGGRPLSVEEFRRMLAAIPGVLGKQYAASWRRLLIGLWLSGLRLNEALRMRWDGQDRIRPLNLDGPRPMLAFPADEQKGRRQEVVPMTPEFARFLRRVPVERRRGHVFRPRGPRRVDTDSVRACRRGSKRLAGPPGSASASGEDGSDASRPARRSTPRHRTFAGASARGTRSGIGLPPCNC